MTKTQARPALITARNRGGILLSIVIDALFVAGWATVTALLNRFLELIELTDHLDIASLRIFQWAFSIATLIPIIGYTIIDLWKVVVRTYVTCRTIWEKRYES